MSQGRLGGRLRRATLVALAASCAVGVSSAQATTLGNASVPFGNYNGAQIDISATITATNGGGNANSCTVKLAKGSSAVFTPRTMISGVNALNYNLYTTAARTAAVIWGDGTASTVFPTTFNLNGGNPSQPLTIFARVPGSQTLPAGIYSDSVPATLECQNAADNKSATVTVTVVAAPANNATISVPDLGFGSYVPTAMANTTADTTATVTATLGTSYTVALSAGGGTFAARRMTGPGADLLGYNLYTTAGFTTVWGDGTGGSVTQGGTGTGAAQNFTVFGRILSGQFATPGAYSDSLTATVTF